MEERQNQEVIEITRRITELRDACGYTPEEFAAKLNIPLDTYLAYEQNASIIPVSQICNIANLCGVDLSEIMTGVSAKLKTIQIVRSGEGALSRLSLKGSCLSLQRQGNAADFGSIGSKRSSAHSGTPWRPGI